MDWTPDNSNQDIEDRRDDSGGGGFGGFGGGGFGGVHLGIGGALIVGLLSLVFHQNLFSLFSGGGSDTGTYTTSAPYSSSGGQPSAPATQQDEQEKPEFQFIRFVLHDVQSFWDQALPAQTHRPYRHATLVLFRDETQSACGEAQLAIGPFYCPEDQKVYLDLGFMNELANRFGAPGQFAQAYVVAHELGHHVQYLLGIEQKVRRIQEQSPEQQNPMSVKLELQADCFAGIWGSSGVKRGIVHQADIQDGLRAAAAVGDDRLQRMARGRVNPDSFTHGTSAQRSNWFDRGLTSGLISNCDTFAANQ